MSLRLSDLLGQSIPDIEPLDLNLGNNQASVGANSPTGASHEIEPIKIEPPKIPIEEQNPELVRMGLRSGEDVIEFWHKDAKPNWTISEILRTTAVYPDRFIRFCICPKGKDVGDQRYHLPEHDQTKISDLEFDTKTDMIWFYDA